MTPAQIAEAQKLAREWEPKPWGLVLISVVGRISIPARWDLIGEDYWSACIEMDIELETVKPI
jgi:hypothetical protein